METQDYIALKKERNEIVKRLKQNPSNIEDIARYRQIAATIRSDPPTIEQQYAAMFEG